MSSRSTLFATVIALTILCLPSFGQTTAEGWFNQGMNLSGQSKYIEAIQAFDKAIELNPQYNDALRIKGSILNCLGKYDESLKVWDKVIEIDPQDAVAWASKGFSLYGQGEYEGAATAFGNAIKLDPRFAEAWAGKGFALLPLSDYPIESLDAFDQAIALDPNYGLAWIGNLAARECYGCRDSVFRRAVQLNPKYADDLFTEYGETQSFQRKVFLNEGCPQVSANK